MDPDIYKIALSLLPRIGPRLARNLVSYAGSPEAVFKSKKSVLTKIPGIGELIVAGFNFQEILDQAAKEIEICHKQGVSWHFYLDKEYPYRLRECEDSPVVLYYRGTDCLNSSKIISMVGTRRATHYGETQTVKLVKDLAALFPETVIVSGFAYGIDIASHKAAMESGLATVAVYGHGIEQVYPGAHRKYLKAILAHGGVCSEFSIDKKPDPGNFVSRNRIIAGLADATVVVESGETGGALITADMANSYNREVFAFPGRADDKLSKGCNALIRQNKAMLMESAEDLIRALNWDIKPKTPVQRSIFVELTEDEERITELLKTSQVLTLDELARISESPVSKVSAVLLTLEFKGLVKSMPGKTYSLI